MQHAFRSTSLGMRQFPVGASESADTGTHVMGVTVMTWLSRFPVQQWGEDWATHGSFDLRFRAHLETDRDLLLDTEELPDGQEHTVRDAEGTVYATAVTRRRGLLRARHADLDVSRPERVPNTREALAGLVLTPIRFTFDAARDLAFTGPLEDGVFWRSRRWAHPAWVASAGNAIIRENVAFEEPGQWRHAGLETTMHAPVVDGDEVVLCGRITEVFDRPRQQFAVAELVAMVDLRPVMSLRATFAYRPVATDRG